MADTLVEMALPTAGTQQKDLYNRANSGMVLRGTFSPPAGATWSIIGAVLSGTATTGDVATILSDIEALAGVTSVHNNFWFQTPASLSINSEAPGSHGLFMYATANASGVQTLTGQVQNWGNRITDTMDLSSLLDSKILMFAARLPAMLSDVTSLESAIAGVTDVTQAKVILIGEIPSDVSGVSLAVEVRMRIDSIV